MPLTHQVPVRVRRARLRPPRTRYARSFPLSCLLFACGETPDEDVTPTFDAQRVSCDAMVECISEVTPGATADALASYGPNSPCWVDEASADLCSDACYDATLEPLPLYLDEPACVSANHPHIAFVGDVGQFTVRFGGAGWSVACEATTGRHADCTPTESFTEWYDGRDITWTSMTAKKQQDDLVVTIEGRSDEYSCDYVWELELSLVAD